jgi:nitrite reductase (NO-forming)
MRPRATMTLYQTAARGWFTLAGLSLLLPGNVRLGIWLPLHLMVAGAASVAIAGAMQTFAAALTATGPPPTVWVWAQFIAMNAGVTLIALGRLLSVPSLIGAGGAAFVVGGALLLWFVLRARRRSLNERHRLPLQMYVFAVGCVLIGGTFGALLGSGSVHDATTYLGLRHAHMTINVLGWVSVTIAATLITLLPTTLRVKMPAWHGGWTAGSLAVGAVTIALGLALRVTAVAAVGGIFELCGAFGLAWMVFRVLRKQRSRPAPLSALHLVAGVSWFTIGCAALAVSVWHGAAGFDAFSLDFLSIFIVGWIAQVLLGAWSFLLPNTRPGHPDVRRAALVAIEFAAWVQVVALNAGVALMSLRAAGWLGRTAGSIGVTLTLGGAAIALVKAWAFPALGSAGLSGRRGEAMWSRTGAPGADR